MLDFTTAPTAYHAVAGVLLTNALAILVLLTIAQVSDVRHGTVLASIRDPDGVPPPSERGWPGAMAHIALGRPVFLRRALKWLRILGIAIVALLALVALAVLCLSPRKDKPGPHIIKYARPADASGLAPYWRQVRP